MFLMFMKLAPLTGRNAPMIASMGRVIEGIFGVILSFLPWGKMELGTLIAFSIISMSIMLATYLLNGDLFIHYQEKEMLPEPEILAEQSGDVALIEPSQPVSETSELLTDPFESFADHFGLTERERDVCKRLLFTEDSGQKMADDLYITRMEGLDNQTF